MVSKVPKVAVVTRTKDRPVLLERAIQSVHSQTMKDFIHVIYNDGGDASSVDALVEKYKHIIDGRIKVVHNTTSKGLVSALNAGVRSANSTYVAIHDDDDSWDKDFLKKTTEHLDTTGAYGVITVVDIVEEKIEGNSVIEIKRGRGLEPVRGVVSIYDQCLNNYATPITFVYRRAIFDEIGYYNEDLSVAEDWDFTLRFLLKHDIHSLFTDDHRVSSEGAELNSIFVDNGRKFDFHIKSLANHYLREELKNGSLGLGYLISSIRHNSEQIKAQNDTLNDRINESVKHELHYVADGIKDFVESSNAKNTQAIFDHTLRAKFSKAMKKYE
jgi:glycosyltransferase involved in cell wall biosynthesis